VELSASICASPPALRKGWRREGHFGPPALGARRSKGGARCADRDRGLDPSLAGRARRSRRRQHGAIFPPRRPFP